jgi:diguanylate cyclase (GGDEF)-like protein/PAS domain S-box-containing protein
MSGVLNPAHCQAILEGLPNGVYVVDLDRKILFWNQGAEQITGYHGQDVVGRHCQDNLLMHCDENYTPLCGDRCPLKDTMSDGRPRDANVYLRHKEGHRVPVRVRAIPVRDAEGTIIGAAEIFDERHDVPELQMHPNAKAVRNHMDERTGVSDENSAHRYLEASLRDYEEDHIPFGVLLIAIDRLTEFRQSYGGEAVAKVMHTVAVTLAKSLREGDIVGDWTENRFLALVVNCPPASLAQIVFMLKRVVSVAEIPWWGDRLTVTVSIGGAAVRPGDTADSLLARAEGALQACVHKGGDSGDVL